jgi:NAD(P)-dependent dehydrogenase (short-subunit alcohol dehydrogenase family)
MDLKLNGRVVVITGPAKGMGAAITRAFASEGGKLALLGRDTAAIEPVAEEARAMGAEAIVIACDVTSGAACDAAITETKARFGVLIGSSKLAYDTAYPLLVGFSSIPKVAVVPIFVLWYGAGTVPAILTAMIICIFPIVVNVATGIATVEPELEDVMKTLKASKLDILWNVSPPALDALFLRRPEGRDHAGFRRIGRGGDGRLEPGHRQHDDDRLLQLQRAARLRGTVRPRGARRLPLRPVLADRASGHRMGAPQDRSGGQLTGRRSRRTRRWTTRRRRVAGA